MFKKLFNKNLVLPILLGCSSQVFSQATPVVGNPLLPQKCFSQSYASPALNNQEYPKLVLQDTVYGVTWSQDGSPGTVKKMNINGLTNAVIPGVVSTISNVGSLNSGGEEQQSWAALANGTRLQVYVKAAAGSYGLVGKLYMGNDVSPAEFYIEGPFASANQRPGYPQVIAGAGTNFYVVYQSNPAASTPSFVRVKEVNASNVATPVVTPAASTAAQNGTVLSDVLENNAMFPKITYNETNDEFGVVYHLNAGGSSSVRFLTLDNVGALQTGPFTMNASGFQADFANICAQDSHYGIIFRDFRTLNLDGQTLTGKPAIRFKKVTSNGAIFPVSNISVGVYDGSDNTLLISNPYAGAEASIYSNIVSSGTNQFGICWATQATPYEIQFAEVFFQPTGGGPGSLYVESSVFTKVNANADNANRTSMIYNGKYVLAYSRRNETISKWQTEIAVDCGNSSASLSDEKVKFGIAAFPNPANESITIETSEEVNYEIFSVDGTKVLSSTAALISHNVTISSLQSGVYFAKLINTIGATETIRFVKE